MRSSGASTLSSTPPWHSMPVHASLQTPGGRYISRRGRRHQVRALPGGRGRAGTRLRWPRPPGRPGSPRRAGASVEAPVRVRTPHLDVEVRPDAVRAWRVPPGSRRSASSPNDQTSFGPPVISVPKGVRGARKPCSRNSGQKAPNWNQRTISSRKSGSSGSPPWKPPMSVVHHGMPERPMFRPARTWWRSESQVAGMSPDQTAAP